MEGLHAREIQRQKELQVNNFVVHVGLQHVPNDVANVLQGFSTTMNYSNMGTALTKKINVG